MTCIVAIKHNGKVFMGADSCGVAGGSLKIRKDPKIFINGEFIIGFTSSYRMGQLLGYSLSVPKQKKNQSVEQYMSTTFIDAVRSCLKQGGYAMTQEGQEIMGQFLVGYKGRIFNIEPDYQVGEAVDDYDACGCGADIALGALSVSGIYVNSFGPNHALELALKSAERYSSGVRGPFMFKEK